jgi:hypothetical protein
MPSASTVPMAARITIADEKKIRQIAWDRHSTMSKVIAEFVHKGIREVEQQS